MNLIYVIEILVI